MSTIINVKGLSKFYSLGKESVKALKDINLQIEKGEICCILGTSGSGKSTLLNQLAGLEKPTRGSVYIGKTNISKLSENQLAGFRQKNIGFVFQSYNLLPSMTALENVAMPLTFRGVSKAKREKLATDMLIKVGLGSRMHHKPSEMSGGQQQRVGIARAFVAKPKIVFADEPTGNLDSKTTIEVMELLVDMAHKNGITFVLVTHDNELANYADRIVTIKDGIVLSDTVNEHPTYVSPASQGPAVQIPQKDSETSDTACDSSVESLTEEELSQQENLEDVNLENVKVDVKVNKTDTLSLVKKDLEEKKQKAKAFIDSHRKEKK